MPLDGMTNTTSGFVPDLTSYDRYVVAFSGGKDSLALLLDLIERGVDRSKIELHHHDVDGHGRQFMDWAVTPAYCRAVARHLNLPLYFSWKEGGFEREMLRQAEKTRPNSFETPEGTIRTVGGVRGKDSTRMQFPQVSADLSVRWCSAYLKIDVLSAVINNQDRFLTGRTLVLTGERAQESTARSKYLEFEPHRTDPRSNPLWVGHADNRAPKRYVDHWRSIHKWSEQQVWDIIQRHGIVPHVAYQLGWGRLSCLACIFGSANQWATIRAVFPERFARVRDREKQFGKTIKRNATVEDSADRGTPYPTALNRPDLVELAQGETWHVPIHVDPSVWTLPAGAYGESAGPL